MTSQIKMRWNGSIELTKFLPLPLQGRLPPHSVVRMEITTKDNMFNRSGKSEIVHSKVITERVVNIKRWKAH